MVWRLVILLIVGSVLHGVAADAADLPFINVSDVPQQKKPAAKPKKQSSRTLQVATTRNDKPKTHVVKPEQVVASKTDEIDLQWALDPLVATADNQKKEGSASAEANLIVLEPGSVSAPYMTIELSGHVVKTAQTTARIEVRVGGKRNTVSWNADDIKAGQFKVEFKSTMTEGELPRYFPVSAIAFVTNSGTTGAVMVSLETITVRVGKVLLAQSQ